MINDKSNNDGKVVNNNCTHNTELYYSSIFDDNAREKRVKRCGNCHQIVQHNVSKQSVSDDRFTVNRSRGR